MSTTTYRPQDEPPCGCGGGHWCRHERWAWSTLASCYPHEAAAANWRRFLRFVRRKHNPDATAADIRKALAET